MLKFVKDGKKVMELHDDGQTFIYDKKLAGAGELKEDTQEEDKDDNKE